MAETKSIASRMQKLAKLKRAKLGLDGEEDGQADPAETKPSPAATAPDQADRDARDEFDAAFGVSEAVETDAPTAETGGEDVETVAWDTTEPASDDETDPDSVQPVETETVETAETEPESEPNAASEDSIDEDEDIAALDAIAEAESEDSARIDTDIPDLGAADADEDFEAVSLGAAEDDVAVEQSVSEPQAADDADPDGDAPDDALNQDDIDSLAAYFASLGIGDDEAEDEVEDGATVAETPDFSASEVDAETLAREFDHEADDAQASAPETAADGAETETTGTAETDGRLTITFDESRTTLLNHVSRQMNCTVEDVVVTALDWYLDALFGEDEAKAG